MDDPRLAPARRAASVVRAWLSAYHCLGGEQFRLGPKDSAIVVIADFAACPIVGYLDQGKHSELVFDLFQRLDEAGLRCTRGVTFSELHIYNKENT